MKVFAIVVSFGLCLGTSAPSMAQTATDLNNQTTQMNTLAASQGQTKVTNKISSDFNSFLGSDSTSVVTGLRNGTPINLTRTQTTINATTGQPVTTTTTTTITPPTGKMGNGEVYISLALAKQQLGTMGITDPTPEQLQAALTGGTITQTTATGTTTTQMQGILTMRSQHMGWGKIAQELGTKLGPVVSSMKSANHSLASTSPTTSSNSAVTNAGGQTAASSKSGNGSGNRKPQGNAAYGQANGKSSASGLVTASGRSIGGSSYGRGSGVVTGSGQSGGAAGSGVSQAGGNGHGGANGKGNAR